jgi:hypothetical protein
MPSELKSATARANGAKSKGPKTAATREKSSQNSVRHGFTAHNTVLLQCEDPDLFQEIRSEYIAVYKPENPAEQVLVDEMVVIRWRIQRLWTIETALMDREMGRDSSETEKAPGASEAAALLALAFRTLADESRSLALLSRYESRLHRMHDRTYRTLRLLQQERQAAAQPQPPLPPKHDLQDPKGLVSGSAQGPVLAPGIAKKDRETNPAATRSQQERGWAELAPVSRGSRFCQNPASNSEHPLRDRREAA